MKKKFKIRFTYNAPVTLTFVLICTLIFLIDHFLLHGKFVPTFLASPACPKAAENAFNPANIAHYIRLFVHVLGHISWEHLLGNMSFILLLGPLLEERYGSKMLLLMILMTALVTGVLNACLIPSTLCGASGIVFMMIVLSSITNIEKNVIPLSFVLVVALFFGRELVNSPKVQGVSILAHVAGGICGSMFGFLVAPKTSRKKKEDPKAQIQKSEKKSSKKFNDEDENDEKPQKFSGGFFSGKQRTSENDDEDYLDVPAVLRNKRKSSSEKVKPSPKDDETVEIGSIEL